MSRSPRLGARWVAGLALRFLLVCLPNLPLAQGDDGQFMDLAVAVNKAAALAATLNRTEIYGLVRGSGYPDFTWNPAPGWFVGNTAPVVEKGIPSLNLQDNGQGYRTFELEQVPQVTSFPSALAVAATWDKSLGRPWGEALGEEFFAKGSNVLLGPGLEVHRVARNGRNIEYLSGESGYLGGALVRGYVEGVHSKHVVTVMKHFVANHQEYRRNDVDAIVSNRTLFETYYPPFLEAIDAGCLAAMCSYNIVNGVHACGNSETLAGHLKTDMQYKGWVMSDWWANHNFSAEAGLDQEMPGNSVSTLPDWQVFFTPRNMDTLPDEKVQEMATRILTPIVRYGLMEEKVCAPSEEGCLREVYDVVATGEKHQRLARRMVAESVVLLKNEGEVLPLSKELKKVALLGSVCNASNDPVELLKKWDLPNYYVLGGSGRVVPWKPISILQAVEGFCNETGCEVVSELTDSPEAAVRAAQGADVALICSATTSAEGFDRPNLSVDQESFVVAVARNLTVPKVSVSLIPGSIVTPWIEDVDAAVVVFLAGEATGSGVMDVLSGAVTPSGKLPVTFPLKEEDSIQPCENMTCEYDEGLFAGFPWYEHKEVTFPFGHGLSYTKFGYELHSVGTTCEGEGSRSGRGQKRFGSEGAEEAGAESGRREEFQPFRPLQTTDVVVCVQVQLVNVGSVAGAEVVQLYLGFPEGLGEPEKLLRGFEKVQLPSGGAAPVRLPLTAHDISVWSEEDRWHIPEGVFKIYVGASSRDIRAEAEFTIVDGQVGF